MLDRLVHDKDATLAPPTDDKAVSGEAKTPDTAKPPAPKTGGVMGILGM
jgi:hypothetical protein